MVGIGVDYVDRKVLAKYNLNKKVGRGLYGIVWKAQAKTDNRERAVAIKRLFNAFSNNIDAKRTYREVSYLLSFCNHPNIVSVHEVIASSEDMDLYLVMEHIDVDLSSVIPMNLQPIHVEFITWQILSALKYIHSASVVHRDIKPQNILVNARSGIRLSDFGMARSVVARVPDPFSPIPKTHKAPASQVVRLTNYCSSRWYRSPEQLMSARNYSTGVDMWALGCVVGEMLQRKPIFPGTCSLLQLTLILHLTGRPVDADLTGINTKYMIPMLEGLANRKPGLISDLVPHGTKDAQDFIHLCLQFNPEKRITATEALEHPFVGHFHHPDAEGAHPSASHGGIALALSDDVQYSVSAYRDYLYADVLGQARLEDKIKTDRLIRENLLKGQDSLHAGRSRSFSKLT